VIQFLRCERQLKKKIFKNLASLNGHCLERYSEIAKKKGTRWKLRLWFYFLKSKRVIVTCLHTRWYWSISRPSVLASYSHLLDTDLLFFNKEAGFRQCDINPIMIFCFQIINDLARMTFSTRRVTKLNIDVTYHGAVLWWSRIR
jgi:hypothetical protein